MTDTKPITTSDALAVLCGAQLALIVAGSIFVGVHGDANLPIWVSLAALCVFWVAILVGSYWASARVGRTILELVGPFPTLKEGIVALGLGVGFQLLIIPGAYWLLFLIIGDDHDVGAVAERLSDTAPGVVGALTLIVLTCVGAPVFEELLYRGVVQNAAVASVGAVRGVIATSVVFAALHLQALQFLGLVLFGLLLGGIRHVTDKVMPAMLCHFAFNATTVALLLIRR